VRCPDCERYMTAGFSRGRSKLYPYYCCRNRSCNSGGSYPSDSVHREFEGFLAQIAPKPEIVEKLGEAVVQVAQEKQALGKAERAQRLADRDRLERQRQELIRMKMDSLPTGNLWPSERCLPKGGCRLTRGFRRNNSIPKKSETIWMRSKDRLVSSRPPGRRFHLHYSGGSIVWRFRSDSCTDKLEPPRQRFFSGHLEDLRLQIQLGCPSQ